jgi:hypothetical protein
MKANQGDPITCDCGNVGEFVEAVERNAPVKQRHFKINATRVQPDTRTVEWVCKHCGRVVVKPVGADEWKVWSRKTWIV